jgi:hypothetical protein
MNRHLTPEDIDRFRRGHSSGSEVLELSRHLQECDTCSVLARSEVDIDAAAATVRDDLGIDHRSTSPRLWQLFAVAAAVAVVVIAVTVVIARRPIQGKPVVTLTAAPQPLSAGYGRADWDSLTADARRSGRVEMPEEVRALRRQPDPFRGASAGSAVTLSPSGEAVQEQQPRFEWTSAVRGPYVVHIFLGREEVAHSPMLSLPTWTPDRPLQRGRTYAWQVTAGHDVIIPSPPAPPALFRIIDEPSANDVAEACRRFPQDHLLIGVVCAHAGLQRCAENELARYAAERPTDRSAQRLAASVRE